MREIKFRAWHPKKKVMFSAEEMGEDQLMLSPDGSGFWNVSDISVKLSQQIPMIPMQFTGLLDKNRKEIYEGDIVSGIDSWGDEFSGEKVEYVCDSGFVHIHPFQESVEESAGVCSSNVEIIGNIYQNPKLLEADK